MVIRRSSSQELVALELDRAMGQPKKVRSLVGIFKDKVSLLKAVLSLSSSGPTRPPSSLHVAVIRATAHHPTDLPRGYALDGVVSHGRHSSAAVAALVRRAHRTRSAHVALKCLLALHHLIISRASPVCLRQVSDGDRLLHLSDFRDESDSDTWHLSDWARWHADLLDSSLALSRSLGFFVNNSTTTSTTSLKAASITRLITEINSLVGMIEQITKAPDSLHYQKMSLVYEIMKLVGEDYRMTLREINNRVAQLGERIDDLNEEGLGEALGILERLEGCKERLFLIFLNKKRYDGVWETVARVRRDVGESKERRERMRLVRVQGSGPASARLGGPVDADSSSSAIVPVPRGRRWLDVEWNTLVVPVA